MKDRDTPKLKMTDIASFRQLNTVEKFSPFINHKNSFLGRRAVKKFMERHDVRPPRARGKAVSYISEFDPDCKESSLYQEEVTRFVGERFNEADTSIDLLQLTRQVLSNNRSRAFLKYHNDSLENDIFIVFSRSPRAGRPSFKSDGEPLILVEKMIQRQGYIMKYLPDPLREFNHHTLKMAPLIIGQDTLIHSHSYYTLKEAGCVTPMNPRVASDIQNDFSRQTIVNDICHHDSAIGKMMQQFYDAPLSQLPVVKTDTMI